MSVRTPLTGAVLLAAAVWTGAPALAAPVDTQVTIRVRAHDAKFVGSGVGGVSVVVTDAETGELLDSGTITGGTGNTDRLMREPSVRGEPLAGSGDATFVAELALDQPTRVRIRAVGPLEPAAARQDIALTTWVVPGKPIAGDGIVLRLPGLRVAPDPQPADGRRLPVAADVTLMCGCTISDGGLWDAADYSAGARIERDGEVVATTELAFSGEPNRFVGDARLPGAGRYRVTVWAQNAETGNTGAAHYTVDVP